MECLGRPLMSEKLRKKLRQAEWRLNLSRFLSIATWSISACLIVACGILLAAQLLRWNWDGTLVLGTAVGLAILFTVGFTYFTRRRTIDAAMILDQECHLKERLSTLISLPASELDHPAVQALAADVERRTDSIDVAESLPIRLPRYGWLPALPIGAAIVILTLVGPLEWTQQSVARETSAEEQARVAEEAKQLAQQAKEREKSLAEKGASEELKDVAAQIEKAAREIKEDKKSTPEQAALKLSDLAKSIEERREKNGGLDRMKQALSGMEGGEEGRAQKLQESLQEGNFKEAAKQLQKLKEEIAKGGLTPEEKEKLSKQLGKLEQQLKKAAEMAERGKQLQKGISKEEAAEQMKKLAEQAKDLEKLDQLADKLGQCSKSLGDQAKNSQDGKNGNKGSASSSPDGKESPEGADLDQHLAQAESMLKELADKELENESLEQMLADVSQARGGMCKKNGQAPPDGTNGKGVGRGHHVGDRPDPLENAKTRNTHARGKLTDGKSSIGGKAEGQNVAGQSQMEIQAALPAAEKMADDAITRQPIPAEYKEHTRDYFQGLHGQIESKK